MGQPAEPNHPVTKELASKHKESLDFGANTKHHKHPGAISLLISQESWVISRS